MGYRTILTILTRPEDAAEVLPRVLPFADACSAHVNVLCLGIDRTQTGYYYAGAAAAVYAETLAATKAEADATRKAAEAALAAAGAGTSWTIEDLVVQSVGMAPVIARRARFSDMVAVAQPYGEGKHADIPAVLEAALFQGEVPAIVLPPKGDLPAAPKRMVFAWNESSEALRAARDALPLLRAAEQVDVLVIDPRTHAAEVVDPGEEVCRLLSRHGVDTNLVVAARTLPRISDVIDRHMKESGAEMLVLGAYSHSRFREAILGGTTRNLLEEASYPVFMAH